MGGGRGAEACADLSLKKSTMNRREERTWGKGIRQRKDFFFPPASVVGKVDEKRVELGKIFNGARWL